MSADAGTRRAVVAGWVLLALYALALFPFSVSPVPGWLPDASLYLLMSEAMSPWPGAPSSAASQALRVGAFPPLFPLLIGIFGPGDAAVGRAVAALALLGALVALDHWLVARGWTARDRILGIALFALLPGTLLQALEGMSEPLYLLASLGALAAASGAPRQPPKPANWTGAALWIGAALLTRSVALTLALALVLSLRVERAPRPLRTVAIALLPIGLWWGAKLALGLGGGYGDPLRTKLASLHPDLAVAVPMAIAAQLRALASDWTRLFVLDVAPSLLQQILGLAVAVLALAGLGVRLRARSIEGFYAGLYLGLIAVWPFPAHAARLLWPVLPMLLVFAAETADSLTRRFAGRALGGPLLALLLAALVLPSLPLFAERFLASQRVEYKAFTHTPRWYLADLEGARTDARGRRQLARAMREVADFVPPDGCVQSVAPEELMWWSRRASRPPVPPGRSDEEFAAAARTCPWFFLAPLVVPPYTEPFYPRARLGPGTRSVILPRSGAEEDLPRAVLAGPPE